jgi:two-component system chemotaxis response regulator CheY
MTASSSTAEGRRFLSVGQCGFDHRRIASYFERELDTPVQSADTAAEVMGLLRSRPGQFALVLVNRILDADGSAGLDLIRSIKADADPAISGVPVLLVSDLAEAQRAAEEAGASPGFGKSSLRGPEVADRLRASLSRA